ncbi:MAG: hypothetical protein IJJ24_04235 [Solobacterium sp.]|nr:hypothetical protein [Solobacterium sp.]
MKKLTALFLSLLLLTGCAKKDNEQTAAMTAYEGYYQSVLDATHFSESSPYFDIDLDLVKMDSGIYHYYVVIDQPRIAMYNIKALVVEDSVPFEEAVKMMPTLGIFGSDVYHMIPYQSNKDANYYKGIVLSGESDGTLQSIRFVIEWTDRNRSVYNRQYFELPLDYTRAGAGEAE